MYEQRTYRERMGKRFHSLVISHLTTDLWIGTDKKIERQQLTSFTLARIKFLRGLIIQYAASAPAFLTSLVPLPADDNAPPLIKQMLEAAQRAQTGPMAAVAGAIAQHIGADMLNEFNCRELIVENGGDIFLKIEEPLAMGIFAGTSPLSEKVGVNVLPGHSPLGICTSSATVGPSLSFGKADALMVAARDAAIADAYATALCNSVKSENDIPRVLSEAAAVPEIMSVVAILNKQIGIKGELELAVFA